MIDHSKIETNHSAGEGLEMIFDLLKSKVTECICGVGIRAFVVVGDDGELSGFIGVAGDVADGISELTLGAELTMLEEVGVEIA